MERVLKNPVDSTRDDDKKPFFNRKGILPTAVSITGTIGSIVGIRNIDKRWGFPTLVASSLCDAADGMLSRDEINIKKIIEKLTRKCGVSLDSPEPENKETGETRLGALTDHIGDKIKMTAILYELYRRGAAPNIVLGGIAVSNTFNAGMTVINTVRHPGESRPVKAGKIGMACQVASVALYGGGHTLEIHGRTKSGKILRTLGAVVFIAGVPFMVKAGKEYTEEAFKK